MTSHSNRALVIVFAKAPIPGQVKTRLIPALGPHDAAHLYQAMLHATLEMVSQAKFDGIELYCAPDTQHEVFQKLSLDYPIELCQQRGRDLGARMFHAMQAGLRRYDKVVLIGTDCLQLNITDLNQARSYLTDQFPIVLGPASDGGYVLIGAKTLSSTLFSDMPWGGDEVLELTRKSIQKLGWQWQEIRTLQDIDRPEDLHLLPPSLS